MNKLDIEKIERDAFISSIMVGNCPKCGNDNTHNCSAPEEVPAHEVAGFKIPKMTRGYDCPVALRIDDPCVGHCDSCGYIWCLECGKELSEEKPICRHWKVCDKCGRTEDFPSTCPYKEDVESGEFRVNPCRGENTEDDMGNLPEFLEKYDLNLTKEDIVGSYECSYIDACTRCPYAPDIAECPQIIKLKRDTKES